MPQALKVALGGVLLVLMLLGLLTPLARELGSDAAVLYFHPSHVPVGFAALGLVLAVAGWAVVLLARGQPLDSREGALGFVVVMLLLSGGLALSANPLVGAVARARGYERCPAADQFKKGNVSRNDTTLRAWVRKGTPCGPSAPPEE